MPSATASALLAGAFGRIRDAVHRAVADLSAEQLATRLDDGSNSVAWLVWHLARVQDDHVAGVAGTEQVWTSGGWVERFGLPFAPDATGYGHSAAEVAAVRGLSSDQLAGYYDAVHERTIAFVAGLGDAELDRIVDTRWTPPVTLGVRLVSVIADDLQHAGQAAFVGGIVRRAD